MDAIRCLVDDGVTAPEGLACDEWLMDEQARPGARGPTLRLYTYAPHAALVGRFQAIDVEVDVAECERLGIDVNRRPTGGGAILMGPDQLGVAFAGRDGGGLPSRSILARLSEGIRAGLSSLGIEAELRGKNDMAVRGRKIAGLGVCRHEREGAFLFHASVLLDLDLDLMLRVLKVPVEKLGGAEPARAVAERTTTVAGELGRGIDMGELREAVRAGFASTLGRPVVEGRIDEGGRREVEALVRAKYATVGWVRELAGGMDKAAGAGSARTAGGVVRARVKIEGGAIRMVVLSGDFLDATAGLLAAIERGLVGSLPSRDEMRGVIDAAWAACPAPPEGVPPEDVAAAIGRAIEDACRAGGTRMPYACYVGRLDERTPEGGR